MLVLSWVAAVHASYTYDPVATSMLSKLAIDPQAIPHYTLQSGLLHYHNRIWIGADPALQHRLITEFHSSAWGGHSGSPVTYMKLKQCFAWKGMKTTIKEFVLACSVCQ